MTSAPRPPEADDRQRDLLDRYRALLLDWNDRVNLVSRKLTAEVLARHIEHCLTLTLRTFPEGARLVDWGTGGGLPAIPLAIALPHVWVTAVDATAKKVRAVEDMAARLGLDNVRAVHTRAEAFDGTADYSVSRATAPLVSLWAWHRRCASDIRVADKNAWRPGLLALKGGDLTDELADLVRRYPEALPELIWLAEAFPARAEEYAERVIVAVW